MIVIYTSSVLDCQQHDEITEINVLSYERLFPLKEQY